MSDKTGKYVWRDGEYIKWEDANIHIMSHVIHYGSSVFEGIRVYRTNKGPAVFRLRDHIERLINSGKMYRMVSKWDVDKLCEACIETVRKSEFRECYIRPVMFRGFGPFGVNPFDNPVETWICTWEWGKYLGDEALENGVDVCISSWRRIAPDTLPALAKSGANYMNSQLIKMEAIINGFVEGIALDHNGYVSEGSGENIFLIRKGIVLTPPLSASVLPGITRNTVINICKELGYEVREVMVPRETLYIAEEVFFTGTAAEITPIRSVDRIKIGSGKRGPVTERLQKEFFSIFSGERKVPEDWLSPI